MQGGGRRHRTRREGEAAANVERAKGQAQATIELARGEAEATIQRANGQAEANRTLADSLSDPILAYTDIQRLTDRLQVLVLPSGGNFLFDLKSILGQSAPPAQ